MRSAYFLAGFVAVAGASVMAACGSDESNTSTGDTTTTTTTTTSSAGGAGGAGGDMTTASGGAGGQGGQGGGTGGAGGAAPCESLGDACSTCLHTMCQDLYCTCYNNAECSALVFTCLNQCDPTAADYQMCVQDCSTMYPGGISDGALLGGCSDQNCATDCPPSGVVIDACSECLFTNCSNEMNTCLADPSCAAAIDCIQMCPPNDIACPTMCAQNIPGAQAVLQCGFVNCQMQCL